ncbi:LytS/YhcK type 5TM receptor domain-containing protein [uncultured Jannaschia sp.]|uniref:LytS/YhcK type 5TM receptor domain-containing protein n=1 Tax=uncultured Jannaschia sp. TaxID=293347 RepID=UPI00263718F9|nr:LytS/YhcK type 5TM receptor domain-containing protein [uncultured Jannaschia sp.]
MMNLDVMMDFVGSLAILGMLVVVYGALRSRLPGQLLAGVVKGALFGLVSVLQMQYAFSPAEGLIIDLRCMPVALAGAFLGFRGCVVCAGIAVAMRFHTGGLGAMSGVGAIILAAAGGLLWNCATAGGERGLKAMLGLAAITSCHLIAVSLLPYDVAVWFLREAAPTLVLLYFVAIPAVGLLMEREGRRILEESRLRAEAIAGPGDRFMPRQAFEWTLTQAATSGTLRGEVVVIALHLRQRNLTRQLWGPEAEELAMRAMRVRLDGIMPKGAVAGAVREDLVLLALPGLPEQRLDALLARIRREIAEEPVNVAGMASFRLIMEVSTRRYAPLPPLADVVDDLTAPEPRLPVAARKPADPVAADRLRRGPGTVAGPDMLFETFDRLHALRFGSA